MPTTAAGTAYTVTTATMPSGGTGVLVVANAHANDANIPTMIYAHGSQGAYNQFLTTAAWTEFREWIIDNGGAFLEGTGGPTDAIGKSNWGAPGARTFYTELFAWGEGIIDVGLLFVNGRSMGAIVATWLYLLSNIASRITGLIVSSGVQTLAYGTAGGAASQAPTVDYFGTTCRAAYGVADSGNESADIAAAITASAPYDPMNFDPNLWTGKNVIQLVGDADTTVPPAVRGAYPLRALYAGKPAIDRLDVRAGGDHFATNGTYHQVAPMTAFLSDLGFGTAVEEPEPYYYEITSTEYYADGNLYQLEGFTPPA